MEAQTTFKRYEVKYILTRKQRDLLIKAMEGHLALDQYGRHTIRNIYFDTDSYRLVRTSMEKPLYKEKLRVRSYQKATGDSTVFVELKKKFESVVYKRRLALPHRMAMDALEAGRPLPTDSQIAREIEAFRAFYGERLKPAMLLCYEREAYAPVDGTDFRLTLDENIRWRTHDIDLAGSAMGAAILPPDAVLMELKSPGGYPLWMVKFLSENRIYKTSFSKYGTAYQQMMEKQENQGGMRYA
ncbi:MAG: polyphosphate polymerase domain-containing protein [Clostridia bacterium]|nr:polyphosphate polymerase domain-containing protein [Clostridia bacterium]